MTETYYRMEDDLLYDGGHMRIRLDEYSVIRRTPKGAWITPKPWRNWQPFKPGPRFVLDNARKRFAYPTEALALRSFQARKASQIWRLEVRLTVAKAALRISEREDFKPDEFYYDETLPEFQEY